MLYLPLSPLFCAILQKQVLDVSLAPSAFFHRKVDYLLRKYIFYFPSIIVSMDIFLEGRNDHFFNFAVFVGESRWTKGGIKVARERGDRKERERRRRKDGSGGVAPRMVYGKKEEERRASFSSFLSLSLFPSVSLLDLHHADDITAGKKGK